MKKQEKKVLIDNNITTKVITNIVEESEDDDDEEIIINDSIKDTLLKYDNFNNLIINANIKVPLGNSFIPQGITYYNDYLLIVGYFENGNRSKCYVLDLEGNIINEVTLDTNSHVGAISYDAVNELIWLPDNNGTLNAYNAIEFIHESEVNYLYQFNDVSDELADYIYPNKKNIAFITIDDNYLYIGNFYKTKKCITKKYLINNDDGLKLEFVNKFYMPPKTQGISFFKLNGNKYLLTSNSFNRRTTSHLELYLYDENITDYFDTYITRIEMPPMSEQIVVNGNSAYIIFESGANKYYNSLDKVEFICILDLNKIN